MSEIRTTGARVRFGDGDPFPVRAITVKDGCGRTIVEYTEPDHSEGDLWYEATGTVWIYRAGHWVHFEAEPELLEIEDDPAWIDDEPRPTHVSIVGWSDPEP